MGTETEEANWLSVIGRSLAFLCLHYAEMRSATKLEQAKFLERFGLSRREAAEVLGSSEASLRVLEDREGKRSGRKRSISKASPRKSSAPKRSGRGLGRKKA